MLQRALAVTAQACFIRFRQQIIAHTLTDGSKQTPARRSIKIHIYVCDALGQISSKSDEVVAPFQSYRQPAGSRAYHPTQRPRHITAHAFLRLYPVVMRIAAKQLIAAVTTQRHGGMLAYQSR